MNKLFSRRCHLYIESKIMQYMQPLVGNLNKVCKRALEEAAELCVSSTHFTVDIEHLLLRLCEKQSTDLNVIFKYYEIDEGHLRQELKTAVEKFKRGNNKTPDLSPYLLKLLEHAWLMSSLHLTQHQIRSGTIIHALLNRGAVGGCHDQLPLFIENSSG